MSSKVLKLVVKEIATPLTDIFNQVMANVLENGKWIPVYKKDDRHEKANYRPVVILSILDKVF